MSATGAARASRRGTFRGGPPARLSGVTTTTRASGTLPIVAGHEPRLLNDHVGLGGLPLAGLPRTLFGLPFVVTALLLASVTLQQLHGERVRGAHAPPAVMAAVALVFGGVGGWLLVGGVAELLATHARARRRRRFPDQPWLADFAWERRGGRDRAPAELPRALAFFLFISAFTGVFGWAGWRGAGGVVFQGVGVMMGLGALAAAARVGRIAWRGVRWGRSRLRFADFPCAPGTPVEVIFDDLSPAARRVPLRATLRCVQERWETTGTTRKTTQVVYWELWRSAVDVAAGTRSVQFALPADAAGTHLAARPARYWELELTADVSGVDYRACFLVPVYARG